MASPALPVSCRIHVDAMDFSGIWHFPLDRHKEGYFALAPRDANPWHPCFEESCALPLGVQRGLCFFEPPRFRAELETPASPGRPVLARSKASSRELE